MNSSQTHSVKHYQALKAAYTPEGERWLGEVRERIWANYDYLLDFMRRNIPQCPVTLLEATYLPWIDITALRKSADILEEELLDRAALWLNSGSMYGLDGYLRINIACSPDLLAEALDRLLAALPRL